VTDAPEDALDLPGLPEDALVVRGGDLRTDGQLERMIASACVSHDEGEGYALSTYVGWDPAKSLPHRLLAVTTVGKVIESGMKLVPEDGPFPCHVNIDLGSYPEREVVERFVGLFDEPVDNPVRSELRRER
jgi:hypothetical protein